MYRQLRNILYTFYDFLKLLKVSAMFFHHIKISNKNSKLIFIKKFFIY